jgi:hypothetical protein
MANTLTECDLDALHATMESTIAAAFPALKRVSFDEIDRENVPVPCCFLDCADMDADMDAHDPGTEQQAMTARYEARFVVGMRTPRAKQEARKLATAFAAFLRKQLRWPPAKSGPAHVIGCYRDDFHPVLDQYEVWRVEWTHVLHFGQSVWAGDGPQITEVFLGIAPEIGIPHVDDYVQVAP